jgi:hypothetical protein
MQQRLRLWALIVGAALFVGVFLIFKFSTSLPLTVILGSEFSIIFLWRLVRAFVGPVATNRYLRKVQILRSLPYGLFTLASFADAWPVTSPYAPWVFLGGVLLFFAVSRTYTRKLPAGGPGFE